MGIYYLKQDDSIWGCGDPECCGEYYEEISETFISCTCEVEINAEHLHSCGGGGPVLEWREATELEVEAYNAGHSNGWSDGADWGEKYQIERIIKLVEGIQFESIVVRESRGKMQSGHGINAGSYEGAQMLVDVYWHKSDLIALIKGEK